MTGPSPPHRFDNGRDAALPKSRMFIPHFTAATFTFSPLLPDRKFWVGAESKELASIPDVALPLATRGSAFRET